MILSSAPEQVATISPEKFQKFQYRFLPARLEHTPILFEQRKFIGMAVCEPPDYRLMLVQGAKPQRRIGGRTEFKPIRDGELLLPINVCPCAMFL